MNLDVKLMPNLVGVKPTPLFVHLFFLLNSAASARLPGTFNLVYSWSHMSGTYLHQDLCVLSCCVHFLEHAILLLGHRANLILVGESYNLGEPSSSTCHHRDRDANANGSQILL